MTIDVELQRRAARLVECEVHACLSSLVANLANAYGCIPAKGDYTKAVSGLTEQAMELAAPVLDYESAAREAGWSHSETSWRVFFHANAGTVSACYKSAGTPDAAWAQLCADEGLEAHEIEVYEHWAVSGWLADKLEAKGERVDRDFAGLTVWARTTTGQAISIDRVIEEITAETGYASGGEA